MKYFDEQGFLIREIPVECVKACSHSGQCDRDVEFWQKKLEFEIPKAKAIFYLARTGAWSEKDLFLQTHDELAQKVLWIACSDIKETGEFLGLIH